MKGPQTLFQTGALGPGAALWVTPGGDSSEWNQKLDWYLNFQISKAKDHKTVELAPEFLNQLKEYEISMDLKLNNPDLLMISCNELLPAKMLVLVPLQEDINSWIKRIHEVWLNLLKPSLRIFLPQDFPVNDFTNIWPDKHSSEITLVPSQKSQQGQ